APLAKAKLVLAPLGATGATALQFKQHPNVAKFATVGDRAIALKDKSRSFPVGQPLGVLKWRYADKDEAVVPLSINCWPTPNNDGTCDVNIEYELEASQLTLRDLTISIPLPTGSYPTVAGDAQWSLNVHTHALDWRVPLVDGDSPSGSLEFSVAGHDPLFGVQVAEARLVESNEAVEVPQEVTLVPELYVVS
ncbi:hypothetical protein AURDEDRAFT_167853, partial [Auricularia subglabra TFB-10046 SS5]